MVSLLVALGIAVWLFHRATVRRRNPLGAAVTGIAAYYLMYMFVDWSFRLIYGGTVHHYEHYADGMVEAVAILAGGIAAVILGFTVSRSGRDGGDMA